MLKLPKDVTAGPRHDAVLKLLTTDTHPLWTNGRVAVPLIEPSPNLATELRWAVQVGFATQGLEQISKELVREEKGRALLAERTGTPQSASRISRILFMANDGAERFYRECDSLLSEYPDRLLGCLIHADGNALGEAIFGAPKLVRAILINDKKAAARVLLSLI